MGAQQDTRRVHQMSQRTSFEQPFKPLSKISGKGRKKSETVSLWSDRCAEPGSCGARIEETRKLISPRLLTRAVERTLEERNPNIVTRNTVLSSDFEVLT
jgi:hypothetical protein